MLLCFVLALSLNGCAQHLQVNRAVFPAKNFSEQQGRRAENYNIESEGDEGAEYEVFFEGQDLRPGNHCFIMVNKKTGLGRMIDGR